MMESSDKDIVAHAFVHPRTDWSHNGERPPSRTTATWQLTTLRRKTLETFQALRRLECCKDGWGECVTCNFLHPIGDLHGGHHFGRAKIATALVDANVWPQCVQCNSFHGGKEADYRAYLISLYGEDLYARLKEQSENRGPDIEFMRDREWLVYFRQNCLAEIRWRNKEWPITRVS